MMAIALTALLVTTSAIDVRQVEHVDLPRGVAGVPEAVLSADGGWVFVGGNGLVEVLKAGQHGIEWHAVAEAPDSSTCPVVGGMKLYEGHLFLLCETRIEVFALPPSGAPVPTHAGSIPLFSGVGVALDVDGTRGHLWVLVHDDNYKLQQYEISAGPAGWADAGRLLDAINFKLPPDNVLSDLAIHIEGDVLVLTTAALTQRWDLAVKGRPVEVRQVHKHIALDAQYTVLSLVPSGGTTVLEVYPGVDVAPTSILAVFEVPFEVTDLAILNGMVFASGMRGAMWFADPSGASEPQATALVPKTDVAKLSALRARSWLVAASRSAVTVLQVDRHQTVVTVNGATATHAVEGLLIDTPAALAGYQAYGTPDGTVPQGSEIAVTCGEQTGCAIVTAVYHCPPCSGGLNGGFPSMLPAMGFESGSCVPKFNDGGVSQPMVGFYTTMTPGETLVFPETTRPARFLAVFVSPRGDGDASWCPRAARQPGKMLPTPPHPCVTRCATMG